MVQRRLGGRRARVVSKHSGNHLAQAVGGATESRRRRTGLFECLRKRLRKAKRRQTAARMVGRCAAAAAAAG